MKTKFAEIEFEQKTGTQHGVTLGFAIAHVYPKDKPPIVIKGVCFKVSEYIEKNYPYCIYNIAYYNKGKNRGGWRCPSGLKLYIRLCRRVKTSQDPLVERYKALIDEEVAEKGGYNVMMFGEDGSQKTLHFKRMPHKWIDEFNFATYYKKKSQ